MIGAQEIILLLILFIPVIIILWLLFGRSRQLQQQVVVQVSDVSNFFRKMRGFLFEPLQTFNACKDESLREAMKYYVYFMAIVAVIVALVFAINYNEIGSFLGFGNLGITARIGLGAVGAVIGILIFVFSILGVWIEGAIIHIGVYLFGGRKGIDQTIKAVIYSMYILFLLSIIFGLLEQIPYIDKIPFMNDISEIIVVIWPLVLIILGVRQLHEITTLKATIGVLFTQFIIPFMLGILIMGLMPAE